MPSILLPRLFLALILTALQIPTMNSRPLAKKLIVITLKILFVEQLVSCIPGKIKGCFKSRQMIEKYTIFHSLEKFFVRIGWKQEATERMRELSNRTVDLREENNIVRKDLLQLLLQLRNQGKVNTDDTVWSAESTKNGVKSMSKDLIAGQLFLFYIAGYETTASTTSFTLYELTQNPEVMEKAKEDVRKAIENHGGKLTYDAISDMKYLEACILGEF